MSRYEVTWIIDVDADSPMEAARRALEIQRDKDSVATVFEIDGEEYDAASPTVTHKVRVENDDYPENPRTEFDNVGVMHCAHKRYLLGDAGAAPPYDDPYNRSDGVKDSVLVSRPLYLMDHGGLSLSHSSFGDAWDSGLLGWHYVTKEAAQKEWPGETEEACIAHANRVLDGELEYYGAFVSNEIYCVTIEDENGNNVKSVGGFYGKTAAEDACDHFGDVYANAIRDAFAWHGKEIAVEVPRGNS